MNRSCKVLKCMIKKIKAKIAIKGLLKGTMARSQEGKGRMCRETLYLKECINNHEQNAGRNMAGKDHSREILEGNEEHVIGHVYNKQKAILGIK